MKTTPEADNAKSQLLESENKTELTSMLEMIQDLHSFFGAELSESIELSRLNVSNQLSKVVEETMNNPIESTFSAFNQIESTMNLLINDKLVSLFLTNNAEVIDSVFKIDSKHLHYSVVLKNDTLDNKAIFSDFLRKYESRSYSTRFPITFQYVPSELKPLLPAESQITL